MIRPGVGRSKGKLPAVTAFCCTCVMAATAVEPAGRAEKHGYIRSYQSVCSHSYPLDETSGNDPTL
jgi:hypothetical protein